MLIGLPPRLKISLDHTRRKHRSKSPFRDLHGLRGLVCFKDRACFLFLFHFGIYFCCRLVPATSPSSSAQQPGQEEEEEAASPLVHPPGPSSFFDF